MKGSKVNTDIVLELNAFVGDQKMREFVLPNKQNKDANIVECFVPVKAGDSPITIHGKFDGSTLVGAFDLVVDGSLAGSSRIEPTADRLQDGKIKYYKHRKIDFKQALTNPHPKDWPSAEPPQDVFAGKIGVKAIVGSTDDMLYHEAPNANCKRPGLGSIAIVVSLNQSQIGLYSHPYGSCEVGGWKTGEPQVVRDSGIPPDHEIELLNVGEKVSQKQSVKFRNHFKRQRVGFKFFCQFIFHYRSQEAIDAAGCIPRPDTYHDLEPGDPINFITGEENTHGVIATPADNIRTATMSPSDGADSIIGGPSPSTSHASQKLHMPNVVESREKSQGAEKPKLNGVQLNMTIPKLGGLFVLNSEKDMSSAAAGNDQQQEASRKSKSQTPGIFVGSGAEEDGGPSGGEEDSGPAQETVRGSSLDRELFGEGEGEQEQSETVGDPEPLLEHTDQDAHMEEGKENGGGSAIGGYQSWNFNDLEDTPLPSTQLEETPVDSRTGDLDQATQAGAGEENEESRLAPESDLQDPISNDIEQNDVSQNDVSQNDILQNYIEQNDVSDDERMPTFDVIRAAVTQEGIREEALIELFDSAGPYQHEDAADEFGRRVNEIMTKHKAAGIFYLNEDFPAEESSLTAPQDSSSLTLPQDSSSTTMLRESSSTTMPRESSTSTSVPPQDSDMLPPTSKTPQAIKQEEIDLTSTTSPQPGPTPLTNTSASKKSKKRKASSVLPEDSPAKLRKIKADKDLEETQKKLEALKKKTAEKLKDVEAREQAAMLKREQAKRDKAARRERKRMEKERAAREAEEAEAQLALIQEQLLQAELEAAELEKKAERVEIAESSDGDSSSDEGDASGDEGGARVLKMESEE